MELDNAASQISKAKELINQYIIKELAKRGVKGIVTSHGEIILSLLRQECLSMSELASLINKDPSTVTSLVKKLIRYGYVTLTKCDADKRAVRASLTESGKALEPVFMQISDDLRIAMYKGIDEERKQIFKQVLNQIRQNLS
jgi:DNA-binding MarR family transcriptional regulator